MPSVEKWKTIATHTGYEVSNRGRIRNKKTGHVLSNTRTGNGYLKVNLGTGPKCTQRVNRLVAFAFLGDPPGDKVYCHHINHDPADNRVENLQWVTPEENSNAHVEWHGKKYRVSLDKESATQLLGKIAETVQRIEKECLG